jgi:hypothetical protein
LDSDWIRKLSSNAGDSIAPLTDAIFIPLANQNDLRLSLGLLPSGNSKGLTEERPAELAQILQEYFQPAVLEHLLTLTAMLAEQKERQLTMLKATSQFCLYVGQQQIATLDAAEDAGELLEMGSHLRRTYQLAEDLRQAGLILDKLARDQDCSKMPIRSIGSNRSISVRQVIMSAWNRINEVLQPREGQLSFSGEDFSVTGSPSYLEIAASRILQWFVQRSNQTPSHLHPLIGVHFQRKNDSLEIIFSDRSRRIADSLRSYLFVPFSEALSIPARGELEGPGVGMPLYMAKSLVEFGSGGRLEDRSGDLPEDIGHKLVLSFPEALAS